MVVQHCAIVRKLLYAALLSVVGDSSGFWRFFTQPLTFLGVYGARLDISFVLLLKSALAILSVEDLWQGPGGARGISLHKLFTI